MGMRTGKTYVDENGVTFTRMINKTGAVSVLGEAVIASTTVDNAVELTAAAETNPIGAMGESGIADGELVWVGRMGPVQFLLEDGTASTHGNWVKTSDTDPGRVNATNLNPPGGGIVQLDEHVREVGHATESHGSGTDVLCRVNAHFL